MEQSAVTEELAKHLKYGPEGNGIFALFLFSSA